MKVQMNFAIVYLNLLVFMFQSFLAKVQLVGLNTSTFWRLYRLILKHIIKFFLNFQKKYINWVILQISKEFHKI